DNEEETLHLNASDLGDIPARYTIPAIRNHEFPIVGVYIDPRVVPGFKYRVRPIQEYWFSHQGCKEQWLFKGKALELQSVGRGYSRRITFTPDFGCLNDNPYYFWSDSRPDGFAFELEVISPGDKFTVFDADHVAAGILEIIQNQTAQEEIGHRILKSGEIEKTVRVRAICKVEWFEDDDHVVLPMAGVAVSTRNKNGCTTKIIGAAFGSHPRRGYTLTPGINRKLRSTVVRGDSISDVPTIYSISGLDTHELPVIGTYIDPRILPGFHYRVRPAGHKRRHLFRGNALRLVSIGLGYGKRITFAPDPGCLNSPDNYFWSDSHPDGLGFEPSAVRTGMKFAIFTGEQKLGEAHVFRADAPQVEQKQELVIVSGPDCLTIVKHIHVDVTCHVTMDTTGAGGKFLEPHDMRVSGTAIVAKNKFQTEAEIIRLENIGLDSQLNVLFFTQLNELVFYPL
ncbi:hypothetical protein AAG570_009883, partial [Ranatra chinensis]